MRRIGRGLGALLWLVVAALVAFGGAGVVAAMNHVPATPSRAELTWTADQRVNASLDTATDRLDALTKAVASLGSTARLALAAVTAGDTDQVNKAVATGTAQLAAIKEARAALVTALQAVPDVGEGSGLTIAPDVQDRYDQLATTPTMTDGLDGEWAALTGRALDAANLSSILAAHDEQTAAAAQHGVNEEYPQALQALDTSAATIVRAKAVRDRLANTTDVSTLTTWIERNEAYDGALRRLYQTLIDAKGKVTSRVRAAFTAEQAARDRLPVDTKPIVVIMADVAQGGLNQAGIAIEEARGSLSDALDVQRQLQRDVQIAVPD